MDASHDARDAGSSSRHRDDSPLLPDTADTRLVDWQRDAFDHRIRSYEQFLEIKAYIRSNPVRAGFAGRPEDWPYVAEWPMRQESD